MHAAKKDLSAECMFFFSTLCSWEGIHLLLRKYRGRSLPLVLIQSFSKSLSSIFKNINKVINNPGTAAGPENRP